jgi:endonuclease G, mitochondrial
MAKRKSARKPRKKVQKTSSFLSTVKRMFIGAFIVVACFIGVLFIYDYFVPMAGHKPAALEKKGQEVVSSKKAATAPKQKCPNAYNPL